jgi:putative flavoprotein involved in K+ transport
VTELDLQRLGIFTVVWATGYAFDFSLVKLPVVDSDGYPIQKRGVTRYPGLYFLGLPWLYNRRSGILFGVGDDAAYLAAHIAARDSHRGEYNTHSRVLCNVVNRVARTGRGGGS